jgi:hypothetical protein
MAGTIGVPVITGAITVQAKSKMGSRAAPHFC